MRFVNNAMRMLQGFHRELDNGLDAMFSPPPEALRRGAALRSQRAKTPRKDPN